MSFAKRISDLDAECKLLGLTVVPSKTLKDGTQKFLKDDYILALRDHNLRLKYPGGVPLSLQLVMSLQSPMLAARYNELDSTAQDELWSSPEWVFEEKFDGCRMLAIYVRSEGQLKFYSRNISQVDYLPCEYDNVWTQFDAAGLARDYPDLDSIIFDAEILSSNPRVDTVMGSRGVITETQLQAVAALLQLNREDSIRLQQEQCPLYFQVFDVLYCNGEWLLDHAYRQRIEGLKTLLPLFLAHHADFRFAEGVSDPQGKKELYTRIVESGGEGCVAKHVDSVYKASRNRDKRAWVKIKRSMTETMQAQGLGDTLDAWIAGWEPGEPGKAHENKIGTLIFHIFVDGVEHELARVSGLSDEDRNEATVYDLDGKLMLNPSWQGRVAELDGQCISSRGKRLRHAKIVRWRPDRSPESCCISLAFLESMVL